VLLLLSAFAPRQGLTIKDEKAADLGGIVAAIDEPVV